MLDFIPEVQSLPSLLVLPRRSQRALHLEVSVGAAADTTETDVQLEEEEKEEGDAFHLFAFCWGMSAKKRSRKCLMNTDIQLVTKIHKNRAAATPDCTSKLYLSQISDTLTTAAPCAAFEVNPVLFVPHAACSCCRLFYKSIAGLTSLVLRPVPLLHVTPRGPGFKGKTRYSIHGGDRSGGWGCLSSKRHHREVVFPGGHQTQPFRFTANTVVRIMGGWRSICWSTTKKFI